MVFSTFQIEHEISIFTNLQLYALRRLMQGSEQSPKAPLGNNARPLQPLHHRTVRTNIDFKQSKVCLHTFNAYNFTIKKKMISLI